MTTTSMNCTLYQTQLNQYEPPNFSVSFKNGVFTLPEVYEEGPYMAFFNEFGTHFIDKAQFGSAYYFNEVWEDSFAATGYNHLSSTGASLKVKEKKVSGGFNYTGSHNDTNSNHDLSAQKFSHNVSIGVDPIVDNLNANSWRAATYTNPLPIMYELVPIYDLFYDQDMCTYEFPNKNCETLRSNLM